MAATPGFESVGEVATGEEALEAAIELAPDLALVDVRMPGLDGLETTRRLRAARPATVVILVSADDNPPMRDDPASCGAAVLVSKQDLRPDKIRAIWEEHGTP